jgi:hypothetical protein
MDRFRQDRAWWESVPLRPASGLEETRLSLWIQAFVRNCLSDLSSCSPVLKPSTQAVRIVSAAGPKLNMVNSMKALASLEMKRLGTVTLQDEPSPNPASFEAGMAVSIQTDEASHSTTTLSTPFIEHESRKITPAPKLIRSLFQLTFACTSPSL